MATISTSPTDLSNRKYLSALIRALPPDTPIVLVGSWARGTYVAELSDIDVLAVTGDRVPTPPPEIQVIAIPEQRFMERLRRGDDFPQWALRFGRPLSARKRWREMSERLLQDAPWPSADRKLAQAERRLVAVKDLLEMGDIPAAEEELRFALSHIARALLLSRNVFPQSRPELARQLQDVGYPTFARYVRRLGLPKDLTQEGVRFMSDAARRYCARLSDSSLATT